MTSSHIHARAQQKLSAALVASVVIWFGAAGPAVARDVSLVPPSGSGSVRAVVVGIDRYAALKNLYGAAADAVDIERTLRASGVKDISVLIDERATRRAFEEAMNGVIQRAQRDDLVVISFAGHGTQMPELVKGSEIDGMDEVFLLSGFSERGAGSAERVVDDEINGWLSQLNRNGVKVLFIADTCHGGGLLRKPDARSGEVSYRWAGTVSLIDDSLKPVSSESDARIKIDDLPNVTFLAAVDKFSKAPEVAIPGNRTKRGALSYAVARAVDRGLDGVVTRKDLFRSARQLAYQYSQTQQQIATEPASEPAKLDEPVFKLSVRAMGEAYIAPTIRLAVRSAPAGEPLQEFNGTYKVEAVAVDDRPDLIWDASTGDALSSLGDQVATVRKDGLPAVVERTGAMIDIGKLSETSPQEVKVVPDDRRYRNGDRTRFEVKSTSRKFLILAAIAGDGTVSYLYPKRATDNPQISGERFELPLIVGEPFGIDNVVAIVSDERIPKLEEELARLDGKKVAEMVPKALRLHLATAPNARVGTASLNSAP